MNRALAACMSCGFVTQRHSHIGAGGRCPKCRRPLTEITLTEALKRRGVSRLSDQTTNSSDRSPAGRRRAE
jgi:bacterioferritin-associated ferredoxin